MQTESASDHAKMKAIVYSVGYIYFCMLLGSAHTLSCLGKDGRYECCRGYMWNETTNGCDTKCLPGFYGVNCSQRCVTGRYGEGCRSICTECTYEKCNVSYGCPPPTTTAVNRGTQKSISMQLHENETDISQDKERSEMTWLLIAVIFSVASFVIASLHFTVSSFKRCSVGVHSSQPPEDEKRSYQALMKNAIYTGPAHVVINADTVQRNFSVQMTTASCDNMSTLPDATVPKSIEEKGKLPNGTVEIYESLK